MVKYHLPSLKNDAWQHRDTKIIDSDKTSNQRNSQQNGKQITATNTLIQKYSPNFHKSKFIFIVIAMNILNFGDCVKNMWNPNK